jgi:hypothetical protein
MLVNDENSVNGSNTLRCRAKELEGKSAFSLRQTREQKFGYPLKSHKYAIGRYKQNNVLRINFNGGNQSSGIRSYRYKK